MHSYAALKSHVRQEHSPYYTLTYMQQSTPEQHVTIQYKELLEVFALRSKVN